MGCRASAARGIDGNFAGAGASPFDIGLGIGAKQHLEDAPRRDGGDDDGHRGHEQIESHDSRIPLHLSFPDDFR